MIDAFWTKWRIRQLARGETLLVGKWLDDYARWLYGRLWYRCQGNRDRAQQLLDEIFMSASEQLGSYTTIRCPMSEWLLSIYERSTANLAAVDKPPQPDSQLRKAISSLSVQPVSETESFWPELCRFSHQALTLLSCDEQRLLLCRYFHLERPVNTAAQYNTSLSEIQALLYKAGYSFRRNLEALTQTSVEDVSQTGRPDSAVLEMNFEKIFRVLVLESPAPEFMTQIKEHVSHVLSQNRHAGRNVPVRMLCFISVIVLICVIIISLLWRQNSDSLAAGEESITQTSAKNTRPDIPSVPQPSAAQEVQLAVRLGAAGDVNGLLGILRTGSFPAQIAAAYYLGRFGDKSTINQLDQAAQKWHAENPGGRNPFLEAIAAIESRMRQQIQEENEAARAERAAESAVENADSVLKEQSDFNEPNEAISLQDKQLSHESAILPEEPNQPEPALIVRIEPNQPPVIEGYEQYPESEEPNQSSLAEDSNDLVEDVNELMPVDDIDLSSYEYPSM